MASDLQEWHKSPHRGQRRASRFGGFAFTSDKQILAVATQLGWESFCSSLCLISQEVYCFYDSSGSSPRLRKKAARISVRPKRNTALSVAAGIQAGIAAAAPLHLLWGTARPVYNIEKHIAARSTKKFAQEIDGKKHADAAKCEKKSYIAIGLADVYTQSI